jgi:outer membrane protein TolC
LAGYLVGVFVCGCAPRTPTGDLDAPVERATGLSQPIRFQVEGEPVDAAEVTEPVLPLTDAVRLALSHSPEIQGAIARVHAARAEAKQTRLLPNPVLSVVVRFPEDGGDPQIEAGLTAELISLLSRPGQVRAADNRLRAAAAEALSEVLDVLADVRERYAAVQTLDAMASALGERLQIIDRLLDLSRARLDAGEGTRLDVLTLETQRMELEAEIADRELERRQERLSLTRLIGAPSGSAEWRLLPWEPNQHVPISEPNWIALALDHRPEVQARRYELAALGAELGLTRLAVIDGAELGIEAEGEDDEWAVGPAASLPLPIFDWGQARRARAKAAVIEARHDLTQVRRQVVEETRQAYAAFTASHVNLERVRDRLIPLLEQRHDQAEAQFRAGQTDVTELLLAEQELRAARTRLLELQRSNTESLIRLHRAVGGPGIAATLQDTAAPTTAPATGAAVLRSGDASQG